MGESEACEFTDFKITNFHDSNVSPDASVTHPEYGAALHRKQSNAPRVIDTLCGSGNKTNVVYTTQGLTSLARPCPNLHESSIVHENKLSYLLENEVLPSKNMSVNETKSIEPLIMNQPDILPKPKHSFSYLFRQ